MKWWVLTAVVSGGIGSVLLADVFLKRSATERFWWNLFLGTVLYAIAAYPCAIAFRVTDFGQLALIWETGMLLACLAVSIWFFQEPLTVRRALAFAFAIIAIILGAKR